MKSRKFIVLLVVLIASALLASAQETSPKHDTASSENLELNTVLMQSTFAIQVPDSQLGLQTIGTVFVMGRPFPTNGTTPTSKGRYVMITAAHVLNDIRGDMAVIQLRKKNPNGEWVPAPIPIQIRANGQALWTKHPTEDIAVMYIRVPNDVHIPLLSTNLLADDATLDQYEIHPGDTLECLGYPFGISSNISGFPILRSGKIASYPLEPTVTTKTFLLDFMVFKGNSGSPVYFVDSSRPVHGQLMLGTTIHFIMGIVTSERIVPEQIIRQYSAEIVQHQLGLAVVVHASLIKEAINLLPPPETLPD